MFISLKKNTCIFHFLNTKNPKIFNVKSLSFNHNGTLRTQLTCTLVSIQIKLSETASQSRGAIHPDHTQDPLHIFSNKTPTCIQTESSVSKHRNL